MSKHQGNSLIEQKPPYFFSSNTTKEVQDEIKSKFGAQAIIQHEKYLWLPSLVGRNKKNAFKEIKDKLHKKLADWKEKLLSKAGKEILIKAVAQVWWAFLLYWARLPSTVLGLNFLSIGVETGLIATQFGPACVQSGLILCFCRRRNFSPVFAA